MEITVTVQPLRLLITREMRQHWHNQWFLTLFGLALLLTPLTTYVGSLDYSRRYFDHRDFVERLQNERQGGQRTLLGNQQEGALRLLRPPGTGSIFVRGLDEVSPSYWDFSPAGLTASATTRGPASIFDAGTVFDLEFLVRTVLGLLAITLGASAVARERSTGVIKLLHSMPLPPWMLVVGRLLGGAITLLVVIGAVLAVVGTTVALSTDARVSDHLAKSAGAVAVASVMYLLFLFTFGVFIAQLAPSTAPAIVSCVTAWLLIALLSVPTLAFLGRALRPTAAPALTEARRAELYRSLIQRAQEEAGQALRSVAGATVDVRSVSFDGALREQVERTWDGQLASIRIEVASVDRDARVASNRQRALIDQLSALSPGALFLSLAADAVGTGRAMQREWEVRSEHNQNELEQILFDHPPRVYLRVPGVRGQTLVYFDRRTLPRVDEVHIRPTDVAPEQVVAARFPSAMVTLLAYLLTSVTMMAFTARQGVRPA